MRSIQGCIIGNNSSASEKSLNLAIQTGKLFAKLGIILVCGGKTGIMEASCKGAKSLSGSTVCILPGNSFEEANDYCDIIIPTGIGYARNLSNILSGDFVVAIGGGAGTLCEIAYAWQFNKKIYAFSDINGWSSKLAGQKIDDKHSDCIKEVTSIEELEHCIKEDFNLS